VASVASAASAASRQVGSVTLPLAVAGHPALELCNTRAGWGDAAPREYLGSYRDLVVWARELALVRPGQARRLLGAAAADPAAADAALERTRAFRDDLYDALTRDRPPRDALDRLAAVLSAAGTTAVVERSDGGLSMTHGGDSLDVPLHAAADATRRLIEDGLTGDVGRCPGDGCGWLFLRAGRPRRWCIMSICGNRAKARRFAERARAARVG
jgi:predicted RNA-binding Zn ribbon-like protein